LKRRSHKTFYITVSKKMCFFFKSRFCGAASW